MTGLAPVTLELIGAALAHVPASLPRDEWARVGMAIKAEYPDGTGFDLFDAWSASDADRYDKAGVRSTWRSIKAGGGVGVATLLHLAKEHGFTLPKAGQAPAAPTPAELAERERQRAKRQRHEQADTEARHAAAALEAVAQWEAASEAGASPYLVRKGVQAHGVRFAPGGVLLVPLRDAAGTLRNLQRIAPEKPASGAPEKLFLKGGRKSGLWHLLGRSLGDAGTAPAVLLVAEGYATAASLHDATGYPVAVAFDAGNLQHVARALRKAHPAALLVVCGDDDRDTEAQTGTNPGRLKASAAAQAVRGLVVLPEGLPDGGSDFNDLHQHVGGAAGLDAVRGLVQAAMDAHATEQQARQAAQDAKQAGLKGGAGRAPENGASGPPVPSGVPPGAQGAGGAGLDRFYVDEAGVWYVAPTEDGGSSPPRRVCGPLWVTGLARDGADNNAALLLEFDTPYKAGRRWLMPLSMLAGDGTTLRAALLSQGFMTPTDGRRRALLTEYLQSRKPAELVRHVPRVGWHGRCYVLPEETLGQSTDGDRVMFHSEAGIEARFGRRGTLADWIQNLSRLCVGNSRFAFAVSAAFAGPLLAWAHGTTGGGFQFTGPTSIGKTTIFLIAASVFGKGTENDPESYIHKWRGTSNGFEFLGEQHNDATLILDELGQIDPQEAGLVAYMLADGAGKARSKAGGGLRQKSTWRVIFLSSGEVSLEQLMRAGGKVMKGGQEVRLIPIPAEVLPGTATETNHEFDGGHELSGWVKGHAARCYGTAGCAWLEHLVAHTDGLSARLREQMDAIEARMVPESAAGQVKRGGRRFALVAAAGEMATAAGLTGWPAGEATRAALACFNAWLQSRGGAGSSEVTAMLRQVRRFLEANGEGRFTEWNKRDVDNAPRTLQRVGFRRSLNAQGVPIGRREPGSQYTPGTLSRDEELVEYLVLPDAFAADVCGVYDAQAVARVLSEHGCLIATEAGRHTFKVRLPGMGPTWCYRITQRIFELDL